MSENFSATDEKVNIIAFHLPQFHTFPENDQWWGEGFTEWVNVKRARPLFENHRQPRVPWKQYYYNMLDLDTLRRQAELSQKYGIGGFCYYHYWFDGKLLMEKPVELLLNNKDIKQKFCFCWANEPWTRSWDGKNGSVLVNQRYGRQDDWEKHLQYLIPFFMDKRYIRMDGMPVFVIYRTNNIPCFPEMVQYWKRRCRELGLKGLYLIEERNYYQDRPAATCSDAVLDFEPMYTLQYDRNILEKFTQRIKSNYKNLRFHNGLRFYDYDSIWKHIIKRRRDEVVHDWIPGAFVDWDNTPRRGDEGIVFLNGCPDKFCNYLGQLLNKAKGTKRGLVFINAWNEWAEGAYLEPDQRWDDQYLKAVMRAKQNVGAKTESEA